jgi:two-component system sensor histidine kinase CpxA
MIGSLTARIFAIFWLTLALVLMLVLMLPKLDSRQMTELLDSEQRQGVMIEQHVEAELANDPPNDLMWWRRLFRAIDKWAPPGQRLLLVTSEGRVIGADRNEMQIIRNFIGQADNADHPRRKIWPRRDGGAVLRQDGEDNYQLYLIRPASSSQSDFINLLFDRPLLLLIVTMLVSSPLLLWLAWSLAKPARKLKNAADEVAQGNLRQHPELEAGPQEFLAAGTSFNQMVSALDRMMTAQQRLLSDISHELRTPLTRLQLGTALLRRRSGESKELERIETEAHRLDSMINDLLVMSRNQQKNALVSETVKANHLWHEVLDNAAFEAEQMGKSFTVNFPPGHGRCTVTPTRWKARWRISCVTPCATRTRRLRWRSRWIKTGSPSLSTTTVLASARKTASRFSVRSTVPTRRATGNRAVRDWVWRLWKPPCSSTAAG